MTGLERVRLGRGVKDRDHPSAKAARDRVPQIIDAISPEQLVAAIKRAPSLRGMILGYIAEEMFEERVLQPLDSIEAIRKHDDHDREFNKADRDFVFKGRLYTVQLKSVQTNSIVWRNDLRCLCADVQNDGSDRRAVTLPSGVRIETTNYVIGDYDILAVPLFPFTGTWEFAYKRNRDCRKTVSPKYAAGIREYLLSSTESISYPLTKPWTDRISDLLDDSIGKKV